MRRYIFIALLSLLAVQSAVAKKQLDHDSFDDWKSVRINSLSDNGAWVSFCIEPQEGDCVTVVRNLKSGKEYRLERGKDARFTADSQWLVARILPLYKDTREAKIAKKKGMDLPQDSLAILNLRTGTVERIPRVLSFSSGKEGGDWIAYLSCDTSLVSQKVLKDDQAGRPLCLRHLPSGVTKIINRVDDYSFSKDGRRLAVRTKKCDADSLSANSVGIVLLPDTSFVSLDRDKAFYSLPVFSEDGMQIAYTASEDTVKTGTRKALLYRVDLAVANPAPEDVYVPEYGPKVPNLALPHAADPERQKELEEQRREVLMNAHRKSLFVNQYARPQFSHDGRRLVIGVAPYVAPDDTTIVDFERADLDIWRWDAPMTPPQELHMVKEIRENQFPVVIDLESGNCVLTTDQLLANVKPGDRYDADWVLVSDPTEHNIEMQWNYNAPKKLTVKNVVTGEERYIADVPMEEGSISPSGRYVVWYADRQFHVYDIATGKTAVVTASLPYPVWDEEQDVPLPSMKYEEPLWTKDDERLVVFDRYDMWSVDPRGESEPVCLTNGYGRSRGVTFRYVKTDPEWRFFTPGDRVLLSVFDHGSKDRGLAVTTFGKKQDPKVKTLDGYEYTSVRKAKDAEAYAFVRGNFSTSPDVYVVSGDNFAKAQRVSDINPQMEEYSWGTANLVKWYTYSGKPMEGVLYLPDDFDPSGDYPMLVVFYETGSQYLTHHYRMEPSWSWINYPFYVSRGYVVFQPDVRYSAGVPGESAYDCICSGVDAVCEMYPQIDRKRIGIDGQSWGGYQTAYLVTRTNMFACAGSGAPVSNMTSAFGGIRWGTGDSRQAQYEVGQSRIGRNLWENRDLYLANSPLFYADRVETPLLIMHNDADGAVPWYQGIEMFMALRRLGKPVWMLQYNGEAHNIKERRNRKDITKRLQQFFDHYLKGDPMPRWMEEGIPAIRKGQDLGF